MPSKCVISGVRRQISVSKVRPAGRQVITAPAGDQRPTADPPQATRKEINLRGGWVGVAYGLSENLGHPGQLARKRGVSQKGLGDRGLKPNPCPPLSGSDLMHEYRKKKGY